MVNCQLPTFTRQQVYLPFRAWAGQTANCQLTTDHYLMRQRKIKSRPHPGSRLHPDPAAVLFHDFFAQSQADAGAFVLPLAMQFFEDQKNLIVKFSGDPDPVIGDRKLAKSVDRFTLYPDEGPAAGRAKFDGVDDQVLEQLFQSGRVAVDQMR